MTDERTEKFADARSCSARIELHVFDVDYDTLWQRLRPRPRNGQAESADYPITEDELRWAWSAFHHYRCKSSRRSTSTRCTPAV